MMKYRENHLHIQTHTVAAPPTHLHSRILNHTDKSPTASCRLNHPPSPTELPTALLHSGNQSQ